MLVASLLLLSSLSADVQSICASNPTPACIVPVEKCMKDYEAEGLEPDIYFHLCADEAEWKQWYVGGRQLAISR